MRAPSRPLQGARGCPFLPLTGTRVRQSAQERHALVCLISQGCSDLTAGVDFGLPTAELFCGVAFGKGWRGFLTLAPRRFRSPGPAFRWPGVYATIFVNGLSNSSEPQTGRRLHTGRTTQAPHCWEMDCKSKRETIRALSRSVKRARASGAVPCKNLGPPT